MMEDEVVRRRRWLTHDEFLDLLGATNLVPGPNSTELAIHIGHRQAGWPGLLVAGVSFILPAVLIVGAFAWAYVRYGSLPEVAGVLYGVKPVIIAIVLQALWSLGRTAIKTKFLAFVAAAAVVLTLFFGDDFSFIDTSESQYGFKPRSFGSFMEASNEAAISRLYGGIHYLPAIRNGQIQGRQVGVVVLKKIHMQARP